MDANDNFPVDLKAMDLSTFNSVITTSLTSKNSRSRHTCCNGIAGSLETQDFAWHKTDTGVKGRNICHLGMVATHKNGYFNDPKNDDTVVAVPERNLCHKAILGKWAKGHCLTAPISFKRGDGQ